MSYISFLGCGWKVPGMSLEQVNIERWNYLILWMSMITAMFLAQQSLFSVMSSQTECCNWIQVCSLLLSEIKGTPVSFLDLEELRKLFGSEVYIDCVCCSGLNQFEWRSASKLLKEGATVQFEGRFSMEISMHSKLWLEIWRVMTVDWLKATVLLVRVKLEFHWS